MQNCNCLLRLVNSSLFRLRPVFGRSSFTPSSIQRVPFHLHFDQLLYAGLSLNIFIYCHLMNALSGGDKSHPRAIFSGPAAFVSWPSQVQVSFMYTRRGIITNLIQFAEQNGENGGNSMEYSMKSESKWNENRLFNASTTIITVCLLIVKYKTDVYQGGEWIWMCTRGPHPHSKLKSSHFHWIIHSRSLKSSTNVICLSFSSTSVISTH